MKKGIYVTYADGAYSIYRVEAIKECSYGGDKIFDEVMFAYYDDNVLGLKLWNYGFKVKAFPSLAAKHRRHSSFRRVKLFQRYLNVRNWLVLNEISNSRYKSLVRLLAARGVMTSFLAKYRFRLSMHHRKR